MSTRVTVIGAGINGLVASNYLARAGYAVTTIERRPTPGGACCAGIATVDGTAYEYPKGASVLGMMQDFVFHETGLSGHVQVLKPEHPLVAYSTDPRALPALQWDDAQRFADGARERWGERGDVHGFFRDMDAVTDFLRAGFREARVPTLQSASAALGDDVTQRWIAGSARDLLDTYFTSEGAKLLFAVSSVESGPVSFRAPYSAFTIPLMYSGSVFDGSWGYVRGGLWQVALELDRINAELGVRRIFDTSITSLRDEDVRDSDFVILATDPLTAGRIVGDEITLRKVSAQRTTGAAGKLVMLFRQPVRWRGDTGMPGFDAALRDIVPVTTMDEFEDAEQRVASGAADFIPTYIEIYPEGAGDRALGGDRPYDIVSIFFNALGNTRTGSDMPEVKAAIAKLVLKYILNPEDLIETILETPRDLMNWFEFPGGNIDHVELCEGQTFTQRTYSPAPESNFYQFGANPNILYCGAASYPCGSVAGTNGYMCARQLISRRG